MRPVDIAIVPHGGALAAGTGNVGNAARRWRRRRGLLLTVRDEAGRLGLGEASPLPAYSPDTLGQARRALKVWRDGAPARIELEDADPLAAIRAELASRPELEGVPSARFALETALLDLAGQRCQRPVWSLLGRTSQGVSPGVSPPPVPIAGLIVEDEPAPAAARARRAVARGLRTLKVKVGRPGALARERELLAAVRTAAGADVELRLDANGALPPARLDATLAALADACAPALIEEPVSGGALGALERSPIPLAVDETLQSPDGWRVVERLAARGLCRAVVLKPMALGGALACLALAHRAAALGVAAYVSHLFDGPVARAAAAHLALALPGERRMASGLDAHSGLDVWPRPRGAETWLGDTAILPPIVPPAVPGLGIAWPPAAAAVG